MTPCDWCEVRFFVMSCIALVGLWHVYLMRVPRTWRRWEDESFERIRMFAKSIGIKKKGKRKK